VVSHAGKTEALTEYFRSIIGVTVTSVQVDLDHLYEGSSQLNSGLTDHFTEGEANLTVLSMNMNSAPGPDGFGLAFYRAAWTTVKPQIMQFLHDLFHGQADLERLNRSHMVLIPKKPAAVEVENFRLICLQNCYLKILSKLLTTRLQKEIPRLIDLHQMGFIRGRSISHTFIHALELVQVCHKRKRPAIVLKLDFAKAFYTVSWDGMFRVLQARGFVTDGCIQFSAPPGLLFSSTGARGRGFLASVACDRGPHLPLSVSASS
jgi:hypothetical protein